MDLWLSLSSDLRQSVESQGAKVTWLKYSSFFNSTCLKERILPSYTDLASHSPPDASFSFILKKNENQFLIIIMR